MYAFRYERYSISWLKFIVWRRTRNVWKFNRCTHRAVLLERRVLSEEWYKENVETNSDRESYRPRFFKRLDAKFRESVYNRQFRMNPLSDCHGSSRSWQNFRHGVSCTRVVSNCYTNYQRYGNLRIRWTRCTGPAVKLRIETTLDLRSIHVQRYEGQRTDRIEIATLANDKKDASYRLRHVKPLRKP